MLPVSARSSDRTQCKSEEKVLFESFALGLATRSVEFWCKGSHAVQTLISGTLSLGGSKTVRLEIKICSVLRNILVVRRWAPFAKKTSRRTMDYPNKGSCNVDS